jgi:hypothetical protein
VPKAMSDHTNNISNSVAADDQVDDVARTALSIYCDSICPHFGSRDDAMNSEDNKRLDRVKPKPSAKAPRSGSVRQMPREQVLLSNDFACGLYSGNAVHSCCVKCSRISTVIRNRFNPTSDI